MTSTCSSISKEKISEFLNNTRMVVMSLVDRPRYEMITLYETGSAI